MVYGPGILWMSPLVLMARSIEILGYFFVISSSKGTSLPYRYFAEGLVPYLYVEMEGVFCVVDFAVVDISIEEHDPGMKALENLGVVIEGDVVSVLSDLINTVTTIKLRIEC